MTSSEFLVHLKIQSLPRGFWKKNNKLVLENILKWIKWFEEKSSIKNKEDWYRITGDIINREGGSGFFSTKAENPLKESIYALLKFIYPEYKWIPWKFVQSPQGFWKQRENRLAWIEEFRKENNIHTLENFYTLQLSDFETFPGRCTNYYGDSIILMLKDLYTDYEWLEWRFKGQVMKHFWTNKCGEPIYDNIKRWFDKEFVEIVGLKTNEDMYALTQPKIHSHYGSGILNVFQGSPIKLLQFLYPKYDWLFWKFVSAPNNAWDDIENQQKYLRHYLNGEPIETLYSLSIKDLPHGLTLKYKSLYSMAKTCFPEILWNESKFSCLKTEAKLHNYLLKNNIPTMRGYHPEWSKNPKTGRFLPFDLYIGQYNTIIEIDGPQHFKQVWNWKSPEEQLERDILKMRSAIKEGCKIIRIYQEDIYNNDEKWLDEHFLPNIKSMDRNTVYISSNKTLYHNYIKTLELNNVTIFSKDI